MAQLDITTTEDPNFQKFVDILMLLKHPETANGLSIDGWLGKEGYYETEGFTSGDMKGRAPGTDIDTTWDALLKRESVGRVYRAIANAKGVTLTQVKELMNLGIKKDFLFHGYKVEDPSGGDKESALTKLMEFFNVNGTTASIVAFIATVVALAYSAYSFERARMQNDLTVQTSDKIYEATGKTYKNVYKALSKFIPIDADLAHDIGRKTKTKTAPQKKPSAPKKSKMRSKGRKPKKGN